MDDDSRGFWFSFGIEAARVSAGDTCDWFEEMSRRVEWACDGDGEV